MFSLKKLQEIEIEKSFNYWSEWSGRKNIV